MHAHSWRICYVAMPFSYVSVGYDVGGCGTICNPRWKRKVHTGGIPRLRCAFIESMNTFLPVPLAPEMGHLHLSSPVFDGLWWNIWTPVIFVPPGTKVSAIAWNIWIPLNETSPPLLFLLMCLSPTSERICGIQRVQEEQWTFRKCQFVWTQKSTEKMWPELGTHDRI